MRTATWNTRTIPDDAVCQEASPLSTRTYIPCRMPAVAVVDNGDRRPYFMCEGCTDHNVRNRGGRVLVRKTVEEESVTVSFPGTDFEDELDE